jgi:hypothetical protein
MAYISQEEKKSLAPAIKAVLKKYGMKGTIGIRHHRTLFVNLQSGVIDFGCESRQVNEYYIKDNYTGDARDFLLELLAAMRGANWFDKSDIMTDYFHTKHYTDIHIGQWNKPYICTAGVAVAG